jgi:hypothetical protein
MLPDQSDVVLDWTFDSDHLLEHPEGLLGAVQRIAISGQDAIHDEATLAANIIQELGEAAEHQKIVNTLRAKLQYLFIYSEEYQAAVRLFMLEHQGRLSPSDSLLPVLNEAIERSQAHERGEKGLPSDEDLQSITEMIADLMDSDALPETLHTALRNGLDELAKETEAADARTDAELIRVWLPEAIKKASESDK